MSQEENLAADCDYRINRLDIQYSGKPKVAFVCVHNSCRSQIAEALGKLFASDVFDSYSAGTEIKSHINPDAVRIMKKLYDIDMEQIAALDTGKRCFFDHRDPAVVENLAGLVRNV